MSVSAARFVAVASLLATGAAACYADYARGLDDPQYGAPNSLQGEQPPGPGIAGGGGGGGDGGAGGSAPLACGEAVDGGSCTVKYGERIAPLLAATGPLKCASGGTCHGASQTPIMAPQGGGDPTPKSIYDSLLRNPNGKPYINGCSYDPAESTFWSQSLLGHESAVRFTLAGADRTDFETWLKCGAPEN